VKGEAEGVIVHDQASHGVRKIGNLQRAMRLGWVQRWVAHTVAADSQAITSLYRRIWRIGSPLGWHRPPTAGVDLRRCNLLILGQSLLSVPAGVGRHLWQPLRGPWADFMGWRWQEQHIA
jgi:hypothetical protein